MKYFCGEENFSWGKRKDNIAIDSRAVIEN